MIDRTTKILLGVIAFALCALLTRSLLSPTAIFAASGFPGDGASALLGTWVKGPEVLAFERGGTYLWGSREPVSETSFRDTALQGQWKRVGKNVIELSAEGAPSGRYTWKVTEDGKALMLVLQSPQPPASALDARERGEIYTRR